MEKAYSISKDDNGITYLRFVREPELEDLIYAIGELASLGKASRRLVDVRGFNLDLTMPMQDKLSEAIENAPMYARRTAILVDSPLSYGRARQFMAYRAVNIIEREVFEDEAAAISWLLAE